MKTIYATLLIFVVCAPFLSGQNLSAEPGDLFSQANTLYEKKNYSGAQTLYQQLADGGYSSKELFYNLGNTYYKQKKYGYAVYYFEKAKKLDPDDEDILFNLELTQLYLKDKIVTPPEFILYDLSKKILYFFSMETWALLNLATWFVFVAIRILKRFGIISGRVVNITGFVVAVFFSVSTLNFAVHLYSHAQVKEVVVLNQVSDVRSEPDNSSSILFVLHEGAKAEIRSDRGEWIEIRLKDGKIGWIRKDDTGAL
jgi:tetratricopeptide (TPR) repeat protein